MITPPDQLFATPFTKALRVSVTYRGRLELSTHLYNKTSKQWSVAQSDGMDMGAAFKFDAGVTSDDQRGLLTVTPDSWTKIWPGHRSIVLGHTDAYPLGELDHPGGYDPAFFAIPAHFFTFTKGGGKAALEMTSAKYVNKKLKLDACVTTTWKLDRDLPLMILVMWLESTQTGFFNSAGWTGPQPMPVSI